MKNILIIKPSSFGDIVQALPAAAHLRSAWPAARISWLVNSQYRRLLENSPCVDRLFFFRRHLWRAQRNLPEAISSFAGLCRRLHAARFDAVMDLQGLFRSGVLTAATGAPVRLGFANAREFAHLFYTSRVRVPDEEMHAVERYLLVAEALGGRRREVTFPLVAGEEEEAWAARIVEGVRHPVVGLSPSARWKTKRWPYERCARAGDLLSAAGASVVIIAAAAGEGTAIARLMKRRALAVDGITDPLKMAALLKRLDALVTSDSGPMHLACAFGVPVVALFGPTNHHRTGPYGSRHRVICAPVDCRPCYRRECEREPHCMSAIRIETICEAVEKLIADAGVGP